MNSLLELAHYLQEQDDFILVGHENPDPDSLGSMLALHLGLTQLGKRSRMVSGDPLPLDLSWSGLEMIEYIPEGFDPGNSCVIVVDCEPQRTGALAAGVEKAQHLINIDHHERGRGVGDLVYVDPHEAATAVIIYRLLLLLEITFEQRIATALYGGILGDTGGFQHSNTTSEVLRISAELLEQEIEPATIARELFSSQPLAYLQLLGVALSHLQTKQQGQLAWIALGSETFQSFGLKAEEADGLVNYVRMLNTAEVSLLFREVQPGKIKLSFRANTVDVGKLARHFGGGGHRLASGATLLGTLEDVTTEVVQVAEHYLLTGEINERNS